MRGAGDWRRRRFSIAHELGHWHYHRGRSSLCRPSEIGNPASSNSAERQADNYAADLLMPSYIFKAMMGVSSPSSFEVIDDLSAQFSTSRVATALRYVSLTELPCILICHDVRGRRWFQRSRTASDQWFPRSELDASSRALEVLHKRTRQYRPSKIGAHVWFDRRDAERHCVFEHTRASFGGEILTLLTLSSNMMV
ncbi:ImmA/IrrE family metallo-endopeptidase [Sphingopyxis sp.]|uniref:ImmA/IrrE family metallo-endopeptidase n=1 Tax=Sphingopyxis sp. TaxID=1908224 RepID=UPI003D127FFE